MRIALKLYASLTEHLPPGSRRGNRVDLDVRDGATIDEVVAPYALPPKLVHLVLLDGVFVPPAERATKALADGQTLAIWPPVAGG